MKDFVGHTCGGDTLRGAIETLITQIESLKDESSCISEKLMEGEAFKQIKRLLY